MIAAVRSPSTLSGSESWLKAIGVTMGHSLSQATTRSNSVLTS
jgi:hypothetical protein